jgi:hypothetical protein
MHVWRWIVALLKYASRYEDKDANEPFIWWLRWNLGYFIQWGKWGGPNWSWQPSEGSPKVLRPCKDSCNHCYKFIEGYEKVVIPKRVCPKLRDFRRSQ